MPAAKLAGRGKDPIGSVVQHPRDGVDQIGSFIQQSQPESTRRLSLPGARGVGSTMMCSMTRSEIRYDCPIRNSAIDSQHMLPRTHSPPLASMAV